MVERWSLLNICRSSAVRRPNFKQLLDEVFVISIIITVEVGVMSLSLRLRLITLRRPWLFWISQKPNLIIVHVLLYIERILSLSLRHKMFSMFVPTLFFFLRFYQFFLFHVMSKQLLCHLRRPFYVCESLSSTTFSMSCSVNKKNPEVIFLLIHWRQGTQSARILTWLPLKIMHRGHTWHDYPWPWVSLTWLLYNLQLDDVPSADFESSLYAFSQSEKR